MRRYEQAAAAYTNYINLLPNKDRSDKAAWSRSQVRFLQVVRRERSRLRIDEALAERLHTVDFRLVDDKVIVKAQASTAAAAGLRARYRLRTDHHLAADGLVGERAADHLHAQRRRRRSRPARPAARPASTTFEIGTLKLRERADADQGAARCAACRSGDRKLLAAGARTVDDHRLRARASSRSASNLPEETRRLQAGRCGIIACRWCAA